MSFIFAIAAMAKADLVLFQGFEGSSGFTVEGHAWYWGVAPLGGTVSYPSHFTQGGGQAGNIFYGVNGYDSTSRMTIDLPDLKGYTDLELIVAIAAPDGTTWESTHRDSLVIVGSTGQIDSFLPTTRGAPLRSLLFAIDLHPQFQDFRYDIDAGMRSVTFAFASTAGNEVIGIDSVRITGNVVPLPGAALLGVIGLSFAGWRLRRRTC